MIARAHPQNAPHVEAFLASLEVRKVAPTRQVSQPPEHGAWWHASSDGDHVLVLGTWFVARRIASEELGRDVEVTPWGTNGAAA